MDTQELKEKFLNICRNKIHRDGLDNLLDWLSKSDFFIAPASSKFHASYQGGLVEHSINVYLCLERLLKNYPDLNISEESVAICALFHDICKANYYKPTTRNVKNEETGQWIKKATYEVDEKFPIGHG